MVLKHKRSVVVLFLLISILGGCTFAGDQFDLFSSPSDLEVEATSPITPTPPRVLSICLGEEPDSLFLYGDLSTSANIIRQAIYDSPVDQVNFQRSSVMLSQIPSLENGLVTINEVEVQPGEYLVDAKGNITVLSSGVIFRPTGCQDSDCWEEYQNQEGILLDQVEIIFKLESGLEWSDGTPITAADSIYSFQVAREIYDTSGPAKTRFTFSYYLGEAEDIVWKGLPGYQGIYDYSDMFFSPLPEHLWSNFTREELLTSAQTAQQPIGWGPYQVQEWIRGDHITLVKNQNYRTIAEGLPAYDSLVFRFIEGGEQALAAYAAGECQIVANEPELMDFQEEIRADQRQGLLEVYTVGSSAWEQLSFGINSLKPETSLLGDRKLRQALAQCINRELISTSRLDTGQVVNDFYLPGDPRLASAPNAINYQPTQAGLALRDLGWIDQDGDPATPRLAEGVDQIEDGTPLQFSLMAAGGEEIPLTVDLIREGLEGCGIGIDLVLQPAGSLLAPGPEGPIFGRKFDLAFFAWATGHYQPCRLFITDEIPGTYPEYPKGWGGVNAPGYSNQDYDLACRKVTTNLPDSGGSLQALEQLRTIFQEDLPALPLFFRNDIILANPDLEGFQSGIYPTLWNIEGIQ
jgi:peptide/nickel transport system substrate-binding protein